MTTLAARLAKLELRPPAKLELRTDSSPNHAQSWLDLAGIVAGWAEIGYANLETGAITITELSSGPLFVDEFRDGLPVYLTAGKLAAEMGRYFATAPEDDAGRPFYCWLAEALNATTCQQTTHPKH